MNRAEEYTRFPFAGNLRPGLIGPGLRFDPVQPSVTIRAREDKHLRRFQAFRRGDPRDAAALEEADRLCLGCVRRNNVLLFNPAL